jgi:hypothetical protein
LYLKPIKIKSKNIGKIMKAMILLFTFLISGRAFSSLEVLCEDKYTNEVVNILNLKRVRGCMADLVWGNDNICFEGSLSELIYQIDNNQLNWRSSGLRLSEAKKITDDEVEFTGIDAQNFWSARKSIKRCVD